MSWTDQNELMRLGKKLFDATGTSTPSEKSMITQLASSTGVAYNVARDAYVKSVLDPLLQDKVRRSMNWLIHANFIPEFVADETTKLDLEGSGEASAIRPDGIETPKRMFNIDTGNMEDWPSGQYVMLSHSWKGQEITYPFLAKIKESQKKRELYEMVQEDSDEEAGRFARFQAKKFKHLEPGKNDIELLSAQCTKDVQTQIKKIETLLTRYAVKSNIHELLSQLAELKIAGSKEKEAAGSVYTKEEEVKRKKVAARELGSKENDAGSEDSKTPMIDGKKRIDGTAGSTQARDDLTKDENALTQAKEKLTQAKERLSNAKASCEAMDKTPGLRSAVEDFLPILERKKSMNKIEGSMREAKRILDLGLFPRNGRKRYLWNDTICINKGDANELNVSLAMMGEWYNNADFCLVHLDTPESTEWVDTWEHLEAKAEKPNFGEFGDIKEPNWATRGWTLQELVLSKMAFFVNSLWQPLTRPEEGLGPYYYHSSYLTHHIPEMDTLNVPPEAKAHLQDPGHLQKLMGEKIKYIEYEGCSEKRRRLIGILDFLGVGFPGDMDDDNCSAYIRKTISYAAYEIESRLKKANSDAETLQSLFTDLHFDLGSIRQQAGSLIKLLVRVLIDDCEGAIEKDRKRVSGFTKVPHDECCRGLSRSSHPAHGILELASHRRCTVAIDKVYSLMGVLGVKFAAFHAEGPTKALCRLLDEVLITTNDISIFNWAGKDLGSPFRGRSLYPSSLAAFAPMDTETAKRHEELALAAKEKRHGVQDTASRLTLLIRGTIDFVKRTPPKDVPVDLIRNILLFIKAVDLNKLRPQLENLGKLLVYLENTQSFEEKYKPKTRSWGKAKSTESVIGDKKDTQNSSNSIASRFGINTPQLSQIPQIPQFSAPKLKVGGFSNFYGKKSAPKEPEPAPVYSSAALTTTPPVTIEQEQKEPESLIGEIKDWISTKPDITKVPVDFEPLFRNLQAPKVANLNIAQAERQQPKTSKTSLSESMICPNPIMLTTAGIEGVFDIQRVVITMQNADNLRSQVQNAVDDSQKIGGECTISTALSKIAVNFSCTAGELRQQLDVCDVVQQAVIGVQEDEKPVGPTATEEYLTPGNESTSYYSKLTSLSSGLLVQGSPATEAPEKEETKQESQDGETQTQATDDTAEQNRVRAMLDFIQETDINLIVGEWVLARFTGADGAKWFLCQLELGSTHNYYGRRIATDEIDFHMVLPEAGLVKTWNNYMSNKKAELCRVVDVLIRGLDARKFLDQVAEAETKEKDSQKGADAEAESDNEDLDPRARLMDFIVKRGTFISSGIVQTVSDRWAERLDGMLSDTILQKVPKELRAAIMNLNENADLLPAMFLSGVKVHMF